MSNTPPPKVVFWLTTAPNPRARRTGYNAGQRGWRTHAVKAGADAKMSAVKHKRSLCGLLPRHGWGMDGYIEEKCRACKRALEHKE